MKHLLRCTLLFALIIFIGLLVAVLWLNLDASILISIISKGVGLESKKDIIESLFSHIPNRVLSSILVFLILLTSFGLYAQHYLQQLFQKVCFYWKEAFVNLFRDLSVVEILVVVLIPFVSSLYFASTVSVSYDEAITYNIFTTKPFYYCMIFYPYPNNHVFHSLLTNITEYTPFVGALFSIRVPAILSSLFIWLVGYAFLKKYYTTRVALLVVGLTSAMYMSIFYSFMSRGYAFTVLAFVICMYATFNIIHKGSRNKDWMFFVVAGILGCYTIPSFLYPFATLNAFILIYNYKNIKQQIIANCIAGLSVILLYSPIMFVDGISALADNQFVQPVDRLFILKNFFFFYRGMFSEIAGVPYTVLILMIIPFILTILQKDKWHLSLWAVFMFAPLVLLLLHAVNPFYRTFLYYNFILMFLVVVPFKTYLDKVPKAAIIIFIVFIQAISVFSFNSRIATDEGFNTDVTTVVEKYFEDDSSVCFPCIASANYEFEAKVRGVEYNVDFLNNQKANVDTINNYGYVILEKGRDETVNKKPFATSEYQNIYKNTK